MSKRQPRIPEWFIREKLAKDRIYKSVSGAISVFDKQHPEWAVGPGHRNFSLSKRIAGEVDSLVEAVLKDYDINHRTTRSPRS